MLVAVWSPKGGSGTSVVAAGLALAAARHGAVRLVDLDGDQPAIFGLAVDPDGGVGDWLAGDPAADVHAFAACGAAAPGHVTIIPRGTHDLGGLPAGAGTVLALAADAPDRITFVDAGSPRFPVVRAFLEAADVTIAVVRGCYLALRRGVHEPLIAQSAGLIVTRAPDRPLGEREVADVLQRPVLATVTEDAAIARAVDAGVIPTRIPDSLLNPCVRALTRLGFDASGRAA